MPGLADNPFRPLDLPSAALLFPFPNDADPHDCFLRDDLHSDARSVGRFACPCAIQYFHTDVSKVSEGRTIRISKGRSLRPRPSERSSSA